MKRLLGVIGLGLLVMSCSSGASRGPAGPPPGAPECGLPQLPTLVDSDECRPIEAAWRSEFKPTDLYCETDADCVEVAGDDCDIVVVSKRAAERAKKLKPLCFKPIDDAGGMCARPTATCEGGCCAALL